MVVGKPMSMLLLKECDSNYDSYKNINLKKTCSDAEIVIAAAGRAQRC